MTPNRAYLSVEAWPLAWDEPRRVDAIRTLLSTDAFRAKELARRAVPAILARVSVEHGEKAAREMTSWGALAACIPGPRIEAMLEPAMAKSFTRPSALFEFETWKGPSVCVDPSRISAIVRAHARVRKGKPDGDFGVEGLHQLHGTLGAEAWDQGPTRRARLHVVELLDIHTIDDRHVRISGDKCGFDALGPAHAGTSRENVDALTALLADVAGGLTVDAGFEQARFLGEFSADFGATADHKSIESFSVYSAWRACMAAALRPRE